MLNHSARSRVVAPILASLAIVSLCSYSSAQADDACNEGAVHTVNAFIRFNPIYAVYFGSLEDYVAQHREQFRANRPAVRCAFKLANALRSTATDLFDPDDVQRRRELEVELGKEGISPGPPQMDASTQFALMGDRMVRMGRGLPDLANGNSETLYVAADDLEGQVIFAEQMLVEMLQMPEVMQVLQANAADIRALAQLEYQMLLQAARQLD